jgi:hypothetical protein
VAIGLFFPKFREIAKVFEILEYIVRIPDFLPREPQETFKFNGLGRSSIKIELAKSLILQLFRPKKWKVECYEEDKNGTKLNAQVA